MLLERNNLAGLEVRWFFKIQKFTTQATRQLAMRDDVQFHATANPTRYWSVATDQHPSAWQVWLFYCFSLIFHVHTKMQIAPPWSSETIINSSYQLASILFKGFKLSRSHSSRKTSILGSFRGILAQEKRLEPSCDSTTQTTFALDTGNSQRKSPTIAGQNMAKGKTRLEASAFLDFPSQIRAQLARRMRTYHLGRLFS